MGYAGKYRYLTYGILDAVGVQRLSGRGKRSLDSDGAVAAVKSNLRKKRDRYISEKAYLSLFYRILF